MSRSPPTLEPIRALFREPNRGAPGPQSAIIVTWAVAAAHLLGVSTGVPERGAHALFAVLLALVLGGCVAAGIRATGRSRASWWWLAGAFGSSALAAACWASPWRGSDGAALLLYNLYYPFVLAGLAMRGPGWPRDPTERARVLLDVGGVVFSGLTLCWFAASGSSNVGPVVVTGVGDTAVLASVAWILRDRLVVKSSVRLLGVGLAALSVADLFELGGSPLAEVVCRIALDLGCALVAAAAWMPETLGLFLDRDRATDLVARTVGQIPVGLGAVVFAVTAAEAVRGGPRLPVLALAATGLCVLTVVRLVLEQWALDREARSSARREEARLEVQKLELLGQIAGTVAHDLNNVLSVVVACADELETSPGTAELAEDLRRAGKQGTQLCRRLVAGARSGRAPSRSYELGALVRDTVPLVRRLVPSEMGLSVEVGDAACPVDGDPAAIEVALLNLVINARDAMSPGGRLEVRTHRVRRAAPDRPEERWWAQLEVVDDGSGMDPRTLREALTPFFTTKPHGTGLGLPSVRATAAEAGGFVELWSQRGAGTRVTLCLPLADGRGATPAGVSRMLDVAPDRP